MRRAFPIGLVLLAATQTTWTQQPRTHDLALTPEHVHWGYYDSRVPPVLRITSGDGYGSRPWSRADCSE